MALTPAKLDQLAIAFEKDGYAVLPAVVPIPELTRLREAILAEFDRVKRAGELFSGGGTISGHLNCFPGGQSRFVYDVLQEAGVIALVTRLFPNCTRMPNVGCNLNLPASSPQNYHIDGYAEAAFAIVNIAAVDTVILNGAMEMTPRSHQRNYKYWEFVVARLAAARMEMKTGDVLIRTSALWHRGMPNRSKAIRPMLALSWEDGGSQLENPYAAHDGQIKFFPNRYATGLAGELRERAFAALPALGSSYRFVRSMLDR